ncbi:MAG: DUF4175 family protein [Ignavibacteriaceae bacterium]
MGTDSNYYKEITGKLDNLTKREFIFYASMGLQIAAIISISIFTSFALLEMAGHFSPSVRTVLFFLFILFSTGALSFFFLRPVFKYFKLFTRADHYKIAEKVGRNFPSIKDDLLNAMQLVSIDGNKKRYSPDLINAAFRQVYNKTKTIQFESVVSFKKSKELLQYTIGVILFCSVLLIFVPGLNAASNRLLNFDDEFIPPARFSFIIQPGNSQITKGEDVAVTVKVTGPLPKEVLIATRNEEQSEYEYKELTRDSLGVYNFNLSAVRNSFKYFVKAEDVNSEEYLIEVIDRPVIKTFDVTVTSPAYSKIPQVQLKDNGNITALLGSTVEIKLSSTKNLDKAEFEFADSSIVPLKINSAEARGTFRVTRDNNYSIILYDENKNQNLSPITYTIKALYDSYPAIDVVAPNKDVSLGNDNRLPLLLKISDDYGFSKLILNYRLSSSKYEKPQENFTSIEIPFDKISKETEVNYVWNLSRLNPGVEDVITYYLEIFDNDNINGPKSTKSSTFNVRVPALDEILAYAEETQQQAEIDLKEVLKEAEELKKNLEKIDQDLKKDQKEITWEEKEKIEQAMENFEQLQDKMENISEQLDKMQQELQKNNLLSEQTLEKYMELQKLMDQLSSEEMKKAMEQMQNMLQKLNRDQVQQSMQNMKVDEEAFQKSIERTLNLLKRIQIEQKLDELLKRSEQITEKQEDVQNETKNNSNQQQGKDELSRKQDELTKDLENFEKAMEELSKQMEQLKDLPKEELDKIAEEFEKQQNREKSEQASQQIEKNQMQQAQQSQSQVSKNMKQMQSMMEQLQQAMQQANQMQTFTDMMRIMDNVLTLSKQQEQLKNESQKMEPNSSQANENAQKQNNLQRSLDKLLQQIGELSQKTFAVTPEMGKSLGDAKREMQRSTQSLQNRNAPMAAMGQGEAMKSLNEAATLMKGSMESMMQGGGQGGMMSLMQQLQQMGQQQMNLNNLTQQLQQGQNGQLSMQQQAELQKLAQQQELIRKSIEQLNSEARQAGQSKSLPGNLENIAKEMQEVITNMRTEKLSEEIIQKQEKILSRMLDAQRSINVRDFEKQRESNTGDNIARQSPAELNLSSEKGKDKIKDELNRAVQEGYTKDYEELIRKYFEALQKENVNN